ncbi:hypothetical protein [Desulfurobacterium sp.]
MKKGFIVCLFVFAAVTAQAAYKSFSCKKVYKSSVVDGFSYQDYCLGSGKKSIKPTPLVCRTEAIPARELPFKLPELRREISAFSYVEAEVPKPYLKVVKWFLDIENVRMTSLPGSKLYFKFCKEVQK